jgi:DNA-binding LacI/PurR family transcriptional regulator
VVPALPPATSRRPDLSRNWTRFVVRDHNGQALAYVYFEDEPGRRSAAKLLSKDEARRIAVITAKLPKLLSRPERK